MRWFIALQVLIVAGLAVGAGLIHASVSPQRSEIQTMVPTWYRQGEVAARRHLEVERLNGEVAQPVTVKNNKNDKPDDENLGNTEDPVTVNKEFDINTLDEDISLDEAKELWDRQLATFVDARTYDSYKLGHIEDAISIPYDVLRAMNDIPPHMKHGIIEPGQTSLVIYCKGGDCDESLLVAGELRGMGFKCFIFLDGFPAWRESGFPIANGPDLFLKEFNEEPDDGAEGG